MIWICIAIVILGACIAFPKEVSIHHFHHINFRLPTIVVEESRDGSEFTIKQREECRLR